MNSLWAETYRPKANHHTAQNAARRPRTSCCRSLCRSWSFCPNARPAPSCVCFAVIRRRRDPTPTPRTFRGCVDSGILDHCSIRPFELLLSPFWFPVLVAPKGYFDLQVVWASECPLMNTSRAWEHGVILERNPQSSHGRPFSTHLPGI